MVICMISKWFDILVSFVLDKPGIFVLICPSWILGNPTSTSLEYHDWQPFIVSIRREWYKTNLMILIVERLLYYVQQARKPKSSLNNGYSLFIGPHFWATNRTININ